jgi:dipeptidase E
MSKSGFDTVIAKMLDRDSIVYGGYLAGTVVTEPGPTGFELLHEHMAPRTGYAPDPVPECLNLVDFAIVPHQRPRHPEASAVDRCVRPLAARKPPFRALTGGETIVWSGARAGAVEDQREIA